MAAWLETKHVREFAGDTDGSSDEHALTRAVDAAAALVVRYRPEYVATVSGEITYSPPDDVYQGAVMLAARLYARRGSLMGSTGYTEFGTGEIMRHDPDIARLLRIGAFAPFGFGAPSLPVDPDAVVT